MRIHLIIVGHNKAEEIMRIEKVADMMEVIDGFLKNQALDEKNEVIYSDPWFPFPEYISEKDTLNDFGGATGIYIFTQPDRADPLLPLHLNNNKIWYIGMSDNSIRARVWKHLEPMSFDKLIPDEIGKQQWGATEWYSRNSIDLKTRQAIIIGKFVVYGIRIDAFSNNSDSRRQLENYLLQAYQKANGSLPVFNMQL